MTHHTKKNRSAASKIYTAQGLLEVINGLPLAIAVIDENLKVTLANKATYQFINKNEEQLIGHVGGEALGCIHHDDAPGGCGFGKDCQKCVLRSTLLNTMEKQKPHHLVESIIEFKQLGKRHLQISTHPMVLNGETVVLLSVEDVTETKKHEQIVIQKEKLSAVIQTAGAICHEMNQPLMILMGFSELLFLQMDDDDTRRSNINEIQKQAERLGSITGKLMNITRYKIKDYLGSELIDINAASDENDSLNDIKEAGMSENKILVVDDEKAILNLLTQVFSKAGYTVLTAESAEQALKSIENENVPVMFFDLKLPQMNGIELCRAVKKQRPMSIVYAITGYASIFELAECREAGFEDYFKKPVNIKILLKTTEEAFEKLNRWKES